MRFLNDNNQFTKERVSDEGESWSSSGAYSPYNKRTETKEEKLFKKITKLEEEIKTIKTILKNDSIKSNEVIF